MEQHSVGNHAAQQFNTLLRKDLNSQASFKSCLRDSETDETLQERSDEAAQRSPAASLAILCNIVMRRIIIYTL